MQRLLLLWLSLGSLTGCGDRPTPRDESREPTEAPDRADVAPEQSKEVKARPAPSDAYVTILQVRKGAVARYKLGDRETTDIDELGRWLRRLKEIFDEGGLALIGRVYGSRTAESDDVKAGAAGVRRRRFRQGELLR